MRVKDYFGEFGGSYAAEMLRDALTELRDVFISAMDDGDFINDLNRARRDYIGRPTPLLFARHATRELGGGRIYIKLEGLANTGAHKINNALGQALLAERMGKSRIIAETGAGQHGVAVAAICARLGLECCIYMGEVDIRRQYPNVFLMKLFGADVVPVSSGSRTLKDAVNEALRDWSASYEDTHYIIGSALGPSPYPDMVREFQSIVGKEAHSQLRERGEDIHTMVACVGGGSNAIGFFYPFLDRTSPRLIGVEAGGKGLDSGLHASRMTGYGKTGIVQGYKSKFLIDDDGQLLSTHSVSAGLDYPGIGPELAHLGKSGRIDYTSATDRQALEALKFFARTEGIVFALESAHAGAVVMEEAPGVPKDKAIVVNMSGRGDKDIFISAKALTPDYWISFLKSEVADYEA